jgi:hypothetical protein
MTPNSVASRACAAAVLVVFGLLLVTSASGDVYSQATSSYIGPMASDTALSAPDGTMPDTRTAIGLGEVVVCSADSGTWTDYDCDETKQQPETDSIGDRVRACSSGGEISPSGVTSSDTSTSMAGYDPDTCAVVVHVYDSETKYTDDYVQRSRTFTIVAPTGETTDDPTWSGPYGGFDSALTPTSVNFASISATKQDGTGSHDDCWFAGSTQWKFEALTGGTWDVDSSNEWGEDWLGWAADDITYYRTHPDGEPSAPCSTNLAQEMHVVEGSSGQYDGGTLVITIGTTTVGATRNGKSGSITYSPWAGGDCPYSPFLTSQGVGGDCRAAGRWRLPAWRRRAAGAREW